MEEELSMRRAEVICLRGYHQRVAPLADAVNSKLWRILPQLRKEDAELINKLVSEARYDSCEH